MLSSFPNFTLLNFETSPSKKKRKIIISPLLAPSLVPIRVVSHRFGLRHFQRGEQHQLGISKGSAAYLLLGRIVLFIGLFDELASIRLCARALFDVDERRGQI